MPKRIKTIITWVVSLCILILSGALTMSYMYSQRYVQDSLTTATTGIVFKTTLNLDEYRNISSGNGWLGKFDRYSRSDRHTDVLTIYCNKYCKKK